MGNAEFFLKPYTKEIQTIEVKHRTKAVKKNVGARPYRT
jgi:hypothetical protein